MPQMTNVCVKAGLSRQESFSQLENIFLKNSNTQGPIVRGQSMSIVGSCIQITDKVHAILRS